MSVPDGKTVCVYVLGIGYEFPVAYSIDIRSHLHNGSANVPTLFWAKEDSEIVEQLSAIGAELLLKPTLLHLNLEGYVVPGLDVTQHVHLGEWLYFPQPPEDLPALVIQVGTTTSSPLHLKSHGINVRCLIDQVFRQWTSKLIQVHRRKDKVPYETFDLMDSIFRNATRNLNKLMMENGTNSRHLAKLARTCDTEYATLMNESKRIIDIDNQFGDELQLAEAVLKTTVTKRKYDEKNLRLKGHTSSEFEADVEIFKSLYRDVKDQILALPSPTLDESCRLTATSTLEDLQNPNFAKTLTADKFNFLKSLSMTGIPAFAPVRDASQINPWTITIKNMLSYPYDLLSQSALEACAEINDYTLDSVNKSVLAVDGDEKTRFNIIIPLVPAHAAKVLKSLVRSNLYAMLSTFCILKNPHIIDYSAHLAALASAWLSTIRDFPANSRPEYISNRLESIIATAKLYMDRTSIKTYTKALITDPDQALMTESTKEFEGGYTVKSESMVKPMFFLYLKKHRLTENEKETFLKLLLAEFIGRCLPSCAEYASSAPYTEFFAREISAPKQDAMIQSLLKDLKGKRGSLLEAFFTLEDLHLAIKNILKEKFYSLSGEVSCENYIAVDMEQIKDLRNVGGCGDVRTSDFKSWAMEMGLSAAKIKKAASPKMVTIYACEALCYPNSRDRLHKVMLTEEEAFATVKHAVERESQKALRFELLEKFKSVAGQQWRREYFEAHRTIVVPMTRAELVQEAQKRGIDVSIDTFEKVYKYNSHVQLVRNACQMSSCPHYLIPHKTFNQHLSVERERTDFPHALHLVSRTHRTQGTNFVCQEISKGALSGSNSRRCPQPPKLVSLKPLKDQITSILKIYNSSDR